MKFAYTLRWGQGHENYSLESHRPQRDLMEELQQSSSQVTED